MAKSLYESLGVSKNATQDEIKKAYRKLVREVHPDTNPGNEERFKEVQGAYDVLSDPDKRKQYDRVGSTNGRPGGGFSPGGTTYDFADFDLGDIFGGLFNRGGGGGRQQQQQQRGQRGIRCVDTVVTEHETGGALADGLVARGHERIERTREALCVFGWVE